MEKKYTFNEVENIYEKFRPTYCTELFESIIKYSTLNTMSLAVEVGMGTGQATGPILDTGCQVTAIELGEKLAAFSKAKFINYDNLSIKNMAFEDYPYKPDSLDLIYSGTAFHWIPVEVGYTQVYKMLKPGGTIALFWNNPLNGKKDSKVHDDIQAVYKKHFPNQKEPFVDFQNRFDNRIAFIKQYGFVDLEFKILHQTRTFNADDFISLLSTYSDQILLDKDVKAAFDIDMKEAINKNGGILTIYDTIDLYLAKKPID